MMSMSAEVNTPFSDMGGSLYRNTYWPSTGSNGWGRDDGMGMAVNLNHLNQILHVVRAGDMLDDRPAHHLTWTRLPFHAFPGINNPMVTLETHLDPVIVPCDTSIGEVCPPRRVPFDSDNLDAVLQMGAVRAVLRDGNGRLRCDAWMSVVSGTCLDFSGNHIVTTTGDQIGSTSSSRPPPTRRCRRSWSTSSCPGVPAHLRLRRGPGAHLAGIGVRSLSACSRAPTCTASAALRCSPAAASRLD